MIYMTEYKLDGGKPHRDLWDIDLAIVHMSDYKKEANKEQQKNIDFIIKGLMYSLSVFRGNFNIKWISEALIRHKLNKIEDDEQHNNIFICNEIKEHLYYYKQGLQWAINLTDSVIVMDNREEDNKNEPK